jgi:hypothetical protein
MSSIAVNAITDANAGNTATINSVTPNVNNVLGKNRIINGNMMIDQRNAGAALNISSGTTTYSLDRYAFFSGNTSAVATIQQDSSAPAGFTNSLKISVNTADASVDADDRARITQRIEGYNFADLNYGSANAKTLTLSFWVKSNLTGIFSVVFYNATNNRSFLKTYTIDVAGTWEQKTITITGDTTGTWVTNNGIGVNISFNLMAGTNQQGTADSWQASTGAYGTSSQVNLFSSTANYLNITGVQLEAGSSATEFEHRQYGTELSLCQRYYEFGGTANTVQFSGNVTSANNYFTTIYLAVPKRTAPTIVNTSVTSLSFPATASTAAEQSASAFRNFRTSNATGVAYFGDSWTASAEL